MLDIGPKINHTSE